ncbi:MAG: hypothetical protein DYG89_17195 [Caldilinea sp. CFX5]|nr:hypothetical protein [Caldilinea sp. CFX5]
MAQIKLYLFGPPRLERQGRPIPINLRKALALLIYLAVTRQPHSRDALATLFWPEKDQQGARANLRRTLYDLSQLLDAQLLAITPETVTLSPTAPLWVDVECFQRALADHLPTTLLTAGVPADALPALVEAADYYSDDFLAGFTLPDAPGFDDWQFFQREALRGAFARLLQQVIATYVAQAKFDEAVRYARRWLLLDPLEEAAHRQLMQLYAQAGQQAAAVRQYDECVRILAAELDVPPAAETVALYEAIRTRRFPVPDKVTGASVEKSPSHLVTLTPPHPVTTAPPHNLPPQNTPFVGRQQEVAELIHRLADPACRLLTIVGPGGIGKTRLAMAAVQQMVQAVTAPQQFKNGLFFVPLQPVSAPGGVIPAIADTLGFHFYGGGSPQEQLFNFLREKQMLLLLDNFEHLLAAADLVAALLAAAPGVKVLITSREALKLQEEWFHPLSGLRLPPHEQSYAPGTTSEPTSAPAMLEQYDAVQLFVQTARRALVGFDPEQQREAIVRICRLVDGMPLALELAASWLKVLSCAQIADEIARGGKILVTRHQNVPARHRNMQVVMTQSWQLLDEPTQQVLSRLSVFQGGFDQDAAAAVAAADLLTLAELVDKAWVYRTTGDRYQMHELLRQFAAEKLAETGVDQRETAARHTTFYLQQVAEYEQALIGPAQRAALDALNAESDNIQTAWIHAADRFDWHLLDSALPALYRFYYMRSRYGEGKEHVTYALQQLRQVTSGEETGCRRFRRRLQARQGAFHLALGELDAAEGAFAVVLREGAEPQELAFVYAQLGNSLRLRGQRQAAQVALQQSLTLARASGDRNRIAKALLGLADIASSFSDFATGEGYTREALALCRQLERPDLTAHVLASLAWAVNSQGAYAESARYYHESLAIAETIGNPFSIGLAIQFLGWVAFCEGGARLAEALMQYERAIAIFRQIGDQFHLSMTLGDYALAASEHGDYIAAFQAAQEGLAIAEALGQHSMTAYNLNGMGIAACGLQDLAGSRRYLWRSLQITHTTQMYDHGAVALYWLAHLMLSESQTAPTEAQRLASQLQALELLSLVNHSAAPWQLFRERARRVQTALAATLPVKLAAAAIARGQQRPIADAITALLQEGQRA